MDQGTMDFPQVPGSSQLPPRAAIWSRNVWILVPSPRVMATARANSSFSSWWSFSLLRNEEQLGSGGAQGVMAGRRNPELLPGVDPWAEAEVEMVGNAMADFLSILPPLTRGRVCNDQAARG
jgi:hypothetical protein